ncbi:hypothetical protein GW17_00047528 [Ensete ventricosum]|nr:hypothetical protein GW17_00047528 [Ensete ventricosum]RZS09699.1 hypothetical protein BHM03_00040804 [Ensete ventricosum]
MNRKGIGAFHTILGHQRVFGRIKIDEPIPLRSNPEQDRGAVEDGGECRGATRVGEIRLPHDVHVPGGSEGRNVPGGEGEALALVRRGGAVEVEEVEVPGVVDGVEEAEEPVAVAGRAGEEVSERGGRRGRG